MKKLLLFAFVLFFSNSYSQNANFSVNLSYNQPYIGEIIESEFNTYYNSTIAGKEKYSSKPSGKFSGNIKFEINSRLSIETGLQLNLLRFQRESKMIDFDYVGLEEILLESDSLIGDGVMWDEETGTYIPNSDSTVWGYPLINLDYVNKRKTTILYTEIPIQIVYSFFNHKLKCKVGIVTSFLTYAKHYNPDIIERSGSSSEDHINKTGDGFSNVLFSGNIGIEYLIKDNIGLNLNYSRSFNSIYDENISIGKPKYNIFSLGISYNFLK